MLEAMVNGLKLVMTLPVLGLMLIATLIGNFFGAVPGLGGSLALALMIPFVFGMEPFLGLAFLLSMHSVVHTGGSIPGILFAIPGTGPTVATILDGYPMTQQGRGGEAMGAQLTASALGGIVGAAVLAFLIPVLRPIAISFGSPEIFALIVLGLTFVVTLSRESVKKGFISALLGLLIGTIGLDQFTGVGRYTFDQLWLWEGIQIVTLVLGIFAFAEIIDLGARGRGGRIAEGEVSMPWHQLWDGTVAVFREWWLSLRTAMIGTFIGIIPGLGADVSTWICYGHAVQTCKNNENFGKGDIRGVIAVETANNAKEGGALLPTIVFGIPGSGGMAILLGAFMILGLNPGPQMITEHLDLVWGMVFVMVIANIIGAITLYPLCGYMGKLAFIRGSLLIPPIMIMAAVGASLIRAQWQDMALVCVTGLLGYGMKRWEYPRPPIVLGFILGPLAEKYLHISLDAWGIAFLIRPVVIVILILTLASICYSIWYTRRKKPKTKYNSLVPNSQEKKKYRIAVKSKTFFAFLFVFIFGIGLYLSLGWSSMARMFPQLIVIAGLVFSLWSLFSESVEKNYQEEIEDDLVQRKRAALSVKTRQKSTPRSEWTMIIWVFIFFIMVMIFGFRVTNAGFTAIFMTLFGRENWKTVSVYTSGLLLIIYIVFSIGMKASLYGGFLGLTW